MQIAVFLPKTAPCPFNCFNSLRTVEDFCHQGQAQKIVQKTYWHDHSLESAWGALSDGNIISPEAEGVFVCMREARVNYQNY
jgi:hypothetical protein